jgi:hypothetical protein
VTGSGTYRYNVQYKSDALSKLTVRYTTSTGGFLYDDIANLDPAASWTQVERMIIAPESATSLTIFHVLAQTGSLSIDEAYLSAGTGGTSTGTTPPLIT